MIGFGDWLRLNRDRDPDTRALAAAADDFGVAWPMSSRYRAEYEAIVSLAKRQGEPERDRLLAALGGAWNLYAADPGLPPAAPPPPAAPRGIWELFLAAVFNLQFWIAILALVLLLILARGLHGLDHQTLSQPEFSRGLVTFLFSIATVCIAIITAVNSFLSNATKEDLTLRFQHGKDILTVLIGVFGTILGFYFGSDPRVQASNQPPAAASPPGTTTVTPVPGTTTTITTPPANTSGSSTTGTSTPGTNTPSTSTPGTSTPGTNPPGANTPPAGAGPAPPQPANGNAAAPNGTPNVTPNGTPNVAVTPPAGITVAPSTGAPNEAPPDGTAPAPP